MSALLLALPLLWAQVNPANPTPDSKKATAPSAAPSAASPAQAAPSAGPSAANPAQAAPGAGPSAANPAPVLPALPPIPPGQMNVLAWLYLSGDPTVSTNDLRGGLLTWLKAVSLLCLVGWVISWLVIGIKERVVGRGRWYDYLGVAALIL